MTEGDSSAAEPEPAEIEPWQPPGAWNGAKWPGPPQPGYDQASAAAHFVAAPLLAAAALSLIGVISTDKGQFGWPGTALILLVSATVLLIGSIQLAFNARKHFYTRQTLVDWYGDDQFAEMKDKLLQQLDWDIKRWRLKIAGAVRWFNAGTIALGLAVAATLVPSPTSPQAELRWAAAALTLAATAAECGYLLWLKREPIAPPLAPQASDTSITKG
ncbi:hypothetical protein ABZ883_05880 [Streptomyces sp. NPDC046977]|uniref:hypothetical protein n=1 Tax=Streptomyces sp. NPDC046977 TaxID=3154703 RepID=UPI0033F6FBCF